MVEKILPAAARGGLLLNDSNPQPAVRDNAEKARDWEYSEEAKYLYRMAVLFRERLIDPIARIDRSQMPDPIISFSDLRNLHTLAAYRLTRNPQGLLYEIIINTTHYMESEGHMQWVFGQWALLETLTHELVHEWQQTVGADPIQPGKVYHNREFVDKCESIGLHPKLGEGYHLKLADGAFAILMKELGIEPPDLSGQPPDLDWDWFKWLLDNLGKTKKGRSSLTKWVCPECKLKIRVGIKGNPEIVHDPCSEKTGQKVFFIRADDTATHVIYQAPPEPEDNDENQFEPERYNPWDDPEDLTAYLEPYQNPMSCNE